MFKNGIHSFTIKIISNGISTNNTYNGNNNSWKFIIGVVPIKFNPKIHDNHGAILVALVVNVIYKKSLEYWNINDIIPNGCNIGMILYQMDAILE